MTKRTRETHIKYEDKYIKRHKDPLRFRKKSGFCLNKFWKVNRVKRVCYVYVGNMMFLKESFSQCKVERF